MSQFNIAIANKMDDCALREFIRSNPIDGQIQMKFQTEPSYFNAVSVQGKCNQVLIARDGKSNKIVGLGTRSIKPLYVNGKLENVGYLGGLRLKTEYRNGMLMARGYQYLKHLHQDKKAAVYITTIMESNKYVQRLLTSGRCGLPSYHDRGLYYSCAINLSKKRKRKRISSDIKVQRGSIDRLEEVLQCLNRNGNTKQFYPYYTKDDFTSNNGFLKDFYIEDFYLASKNDRVVGVIAKWDQNNFKQIIIAGYKRSVRFIKPLYNLGAKVLGFSPLPEPNSQFNFFYAGFIAVDSNDIQIFRILLHHIYNDSAGKGYDYFLVGLHSEDPLLKAIEEYLHIKYNSRLYIVCWDDGEIFLKSLDTRIPYLEIGAL